MKKLCVIEKRSESAFISWEDSAIYDLIIDLESYKRFNYKIEYKSNCIYLYKDSELHSIIIIKEIDIEDFLK